MPRTPQNLADKELKPEFGSAVVRCSPIGVLLGVQPWNFPFYQVARFAAQILWLEIRLYKTRINGSSMRHCY
jgi:acyl-CoA reductase-like NAD-dependent aldehyde dehydrogenase